MEKELVIKGEEDLKIFMALLTTCRVSFKKLLKRKNDKNLKACDEFCEKYLSLCSEMINVENVEEMA